MITPVMLGEMHAESFAADPKHLGFVLARYKFVAKMFAGFDRVLEVGCGDGTGANLVKAAVKTWQGIDREKTPAVSVTWDILGGPYKWDCDGVYALDVLEHIPVEREDRALQNMRAGLSGFSGVMIIGMPSKESQPYASILSREHHVNCKTEDDLRKTMARHFRHVFMFGMNDETLHTGFGPFCHYRLALCVGPR